MVKKIVLAIAVVGLVGGVYAYLQFNKEHRDVEGEMATIEISAVDLFDAYLKDEKGANALYLDKVVAISGMVLEMDVENNMMVLKTNDVFGTVNAQFDTKKGLMNIMVSQEVLVKGRCTGGDDLGVIITQCSILKN
jgi:hypothetical protein